MEMRCKMRCKAVPWDGWGTEHGAVKAVSYWWKPGSEEQGLGECEVLRQVMLCRNVPSDDRGSCEESGEGFRGALRNAAWEHGRTAGCRSSLQGDSWQRQLYRRKGVVMPGFALRVVVKAKKWWGRLPEA